MIDVTFNKNDLVLRVPKGTIDNHYLEKMVNFLELERITEKSELSADMAWELSEELKKNWWKENGEKFLKGALSE